MTQAEREDILREFNAELESDDLNRQLAGELTEKYNSKVRELKAQNLE